MLTYRLRIKPLGKCEDVFIEARDMDYALAVGKKYCEERKVNFVSVMLNSVASEGILTEVEKEGVETAKKDREERGKRKGAGEVAAETVSVPPSGGKGKWPVMGAQPGVI